LNGIDPTTRFGIFAIAEISPATTSPAGASQNNTATQHRTELLIRFTG
jgi:hypothetical protein